MKYCTQCGNELQDEARFCSKCGAQSSLSPNENPPEMTAVEASPVVNEPVHNEGQSNMDQPAPDLPEEQAAAILMDSPEPAELEPTGALPMDEVPLPAATKLVPWIMAGVAVILILGVWAVYAMGNFGAAEIARLAPEDTEVFMSVKPNVLQYRNANQLWESYISEPDTKEAMDKIMEQLQDEMEEDIDFEKDIKPWLGKEAAFIMPEIDKEDFVLAVESKNTEKADDFIKIMAKEQGDTDEESYEDVTITYDESGGFAATQAKGYLMLSSSKDLLKGTIDRASGKDEEENLTQNEEYQKIAKSLPWNRSVLCFVNYEEVINAAIQDEPDLDQFADQLKGFNSIGLSLSIEDTGIRSDYVLACDDNIPDYLKADADNKGFDSTLKILPAETIGFVSSPELVGSIKYILDEGTLGSDVENGLDEVESTLGIDLEDDILNVLKGDATLAVLPEHGELFGQELSGNTFFSLIMTLGVNDKETAQSKTEKVLDSLESKTGVIKADSQKINDNPAYIISMTDYNWATSETMEKEIMGLGLRDNSLVVGSSPEVLEMALKNKKSLGKDENYRTAFAPYPANWQPVLYFNVESFTDILSDALRKYDGDSSVEQYQTEVEPLIKPVKLVSAAGSGYDKKAGTICGACFISIKK